MELKSRVVFLNESLDKFFGDVHEGEYNCSHKELTSLVELDIPSTINGAFACWDNKLTNLIGCPQVVTGNFVCGDNKLTSLEGCPQEVTGDFYCNDNDLTSLEGCPQVVTVNFGCRNNNKLINLDFLPQIGGSLYIRDCPLITEEMIEEVKRSGKVKGKIYSNYGTKK